MIIAERIDGIIWDFDGVIRPYQDLKKSLPYFHRAAANAFNIVAARNNINHDISEETAHEMAKKSFLERKLSAAVFYEDHGVSRLEMHIESHRQLTLSREYIMATLPGFRENFLAMRPMKHIIVTQASCEWPMPNLQDIGLAEAFHPIVIGFETNDFAKKSEDQRPFLMAANILGIAPDRLAVAEDTMANLRIPKNGLNMQSALMRDNGAGEILAHGDKDIAPYVDEAFETPIPFMQRFILG